MIQTTRIIAVSALLLWSMTASAQELVHFPSFEDNGPGRPSTVLDGYLSRPTGEGQHPAVIFLHGCGGLLMGWLMGWKIEPGESDWAGELTRRGYAVLMVDSYAPRGRREMCAPRTSDRCSIAIGRETLMGRCCFCRRNLLLRRIALA